MKKQIITILIILAIFIGSSALMFAQTCKNYSIGSGLSWTATNNSVTIMSNVTEKIRINSCTYYFNNYGSSYSKDCGITGTILEGWGSTSFSKNVYVTRVEATAQSCD